jgi:hypothetical protein
VPDIDRTDESVEAVAQWIADVYDKLGQWNPRNADRFDAPILLEGLGFSIGAVFNARPDLADDDDLRRLHICRNRLRDITGE